MELIITLQTFQDYEGLGMQSILISLILILFGAIGFLYKQNASLQKESKQELKESMDLIKAINEKYNQFTDTIKEMFRNGRNN